MRASCVVLLASVLVLLVGCPSGGGGSLDARANGDAPATDGAASLDARDAPAAEDAPPTADALDVPAEVRRPCGGCAPGQTCRDTTCVDDCRGDGAEPCAAPTVCDFLSGRCVEPGRACTLTGTPVTCGSGEFPARCGPGSRCDAGAQRCEAAPECMRVVCDATNFCRGADCALPGGGVRGLALDPIADATAGATMGIRARATVTADALCGLTVTFELRRDLELFVSAGNDRGIWRVPFDGGAASVWVTETEPISGVTADRTGTLYYALQRSGTIRRVRVAGGAPMPERFGVVPMATRLARLAFGPDGSLYAAADQRVFQLAADGSVARTWTVSGSTFFTGLVFDRDGALLAGQHWPTVWRLVPGAASFASYVDATPVVAPGTLSPWNEGMALGPDGLVYVGVFPNTNVAGVVYRIEAGGAPRRVLGLAEIQRDVPATRHAGIHGLAFGVDGTLYIVNQNTAGNTREALGQVLALRPGGRIELVASGLNLDWPDGFDGDIVVAQGTVRSASVAVDAAGRADGALDAPMAPGTYGVRALVTDPRTGAISEARGTVRVR